VNCKRWRSQRKIAATKCDARGWAGHEGHEEDAKGREGKTRNIVKNQVHVGRQCENGAKGA
jgi:hypothetical protein